MFTSALVILFLPPQKVKNACICAVVEHSEGLYGAMLISSFLHKCQNVIFWLYRERLVLPSIQYLFNDKTLMLHITRVLPVISSPIQSLNSFFPAIYKGWTKAENTISFPKPASPLVSGQEMQRLWAIQKPKPGISGSGLLVRLRRGSWTKWTRFQQPIRFGRLFGRLLV